MADGDEEDEYDSFDDDDDKERKKKGPEPSLWVRAAFARGFMPLSLTLATRHYDSEFQSIGVENQQDCVTEALLADPGLLPAAVKNGESS